MHSSLNWERPISLSRAARFARELLRQPAVYAAMLLLALAALIFWRRWIGAVNEPLPAAGFLLAGISLSLLAGVAHWSGKFFPAQKYVRWFAKIALALSLLAAAAALTVPGTSPPAMIAFGMLLLFEEGWARRTRFPRAADCRPAESPAQARQLLRDAAAPAISMPLPDIEPKIGETVLLEDVTQQFTRSTAADGAEVLSGWLRMPFAAGQRTQSVHLAFCPPFPRTPALTVAQTDGPAARIKTAQILPYGARLDLKLHAAPETPAPVVLHFSARAEGKENI
ncbi:MAG: hypothetical protein IT426_02805 [Pirellulales bacterium]|nr:hypothetical protein [Pirellulales bacterium]